MFKVPLKKENNYGKLITKGKDDNTNHTKKIKRKYNVK